MITDDKVQIGIVINCYDHDGLHRILEVLTNDSPEVYIFFFISTTPHVDFGDKIQMNFAKDKYFVCRGNSRLTYRITPLEFPGTLLFELISERMNP